MLKLKQLYVHQEDERLADNYSVSAGFITITCENGVRWHTSGMYADGAYKVYVNTPIGLKSFWLHEDLLPEKASEFLAVIQGRKTMYF